jgi:hypothetical protein
MNAHVEIEAGVCGFRTTARITSEDNQNVSFDVQSTCEKIQRLGALLRGAGVISTQRHKGTKKARDFLL